MRWDGKTEFCAVVHRALQTADVNTSMPDGATAAALFSNRLAIV